MEPPADEAWVWLFAMSYSIESLAPSLLSEACLEHSQHGTFSRAYPALSDFIPSLDPMCYVDE